MFTWRWRKKHSPNSIFHFCWHLCAMFVGFFCSGILFSCLQDAVPQLRFELPLQIQQLFSREIELPGILIWLPDAIRLALLQSAPAMMLFVLGLRAGEFFCLSRIWNLIFFALHGILFHRFLLLFLQIRWSSTPMTIHPSVLTLVLFLFCAVILALSVIFLQINRVAAKGILIPCYGINRFFYPNTTATPQGTHLLKNYALAAAKFTVLTYLLELLLLILSYGLKKLY